MSRYISAKTDYSYTIDYTHHDSTTTDASLMQDRCKIDASSDLISRQEAIDVLTVGEEMLKRVLDDMDVVGNERKKYA